MGEVIEYREETDGAEQFWFTSEKGNTIWINRITFFKGKYKEEWEWELDEEILSQPRNGDKDFAVFDIIDHSIIYKTNLGSELRTYMSCKYNYIDYLEGEENTNEILRERLDNRHCHTCNGTDSIRVQQNADECTSC